VLVKEMRSLGLNVELDDGRRKLDACTAGRNNDRRRSELA
jgi:hypothetical protein